MSILHLQTTKMARRAVLASGLLNGRRGGGGGIKPGGPIVIEIFMTIPTTPDQLVKELFNEPFNGVFTSPIKHFSTGKPSQNYHEQNIQLSVVFVCLSRWML